MAETALPTSAVFDFRPQPGNVAARAAAIVVLQKARLCIVILPIERIHVASEPVLVSYVF
jgi:hypothetical protein